MSDRIAASRRRLLGAALGLSIVSLLWSGAAAAEPPPERDWDLALYAYGWAPMVLADGEARIDGELYSPEFDTDFSDVFSEWDFGAGLGLDFRYWRFVMLLDGVWVQSEVDGHIAGSEIDGHLTNVVADGKLGFRVVDRTTPWGDASSLDAPRLFVDLLAGARYWFVKNDAMDLEGFPANDLNYQTDKDWVDPLVGARVVVGILPTLSFALVGDVGGFDIGNGSELTWMVYPMLNWQPFERVSFFAGYKHLRADRERPSTNKDFDYELSGPTLGLGFHF
jgi:hypothetical protein